MANPMSPAERSRFGRVFRALLQDLADDSLADYLKETRECIKARALRAAVVMAWCATGYHLRCLVRAAGFGYFNKFSPKNKVRVWDDLYEVPDENLLNASKAAGIITTEDHFRLVEFRTRRHKCAHPDDVYYPTLNEVLTVLEETIVPFLSRKAGGGHLTPQVVATIVAGEHDVDEGRARRLMDAVAENFRLPLAEKLLDIYFDPEHPELRGRVIHVWRELGRRLDDVNKARINRKIAYRLPQASLESDAPVRPLVFWFSLGHNSIPDRHKLLDNSLSEFQALISGGQCHEEDLENLLAMEKHSDGPYQDKCLGLLEEARIRIMTSARRPFALIP